MSEEKPKREFPKELKVSVKDRMAEADKKSLEQFMKKLEEQNDLKSRKLA